MKTLATLLLSSVIALSSVAQWELVTPIKTRSEFPGIQMVSDQIGYAIDRPLGVILRTDDGGTTWARLANNITSQPRALFMWDALRGLVVAGGGTVIRTANGFQTTTTSLNATFGNISCVHFVNDTLGWIGTESGKIYRSTDAGVNWTLMASGQPTTKYITAIQFVDTAIGYASCYAGELLKSIDGGLTWQGIGPFDQLVLIQDTIFPWNVERADQPAGEVRVLDEGDEPRLNISRQGVGHADVLVRQSLNQDVAEVASLRLLVTFRVLSQSLEVCGVLGSECPLFLRVNYVDGGGFSNTWQHGFYAVGEPIPGVQPDGCAICAMVQDTHERVPLGQEYFYDIDLGAEIARQGRVPPRFIESIILVSSGHNFEVEVVDVSLLASD